MNRLRKKNCSQPLSFNIESRRLKTQKKDFNHVEGFKNKAWKFKAWTRQNILRLTSYLWH